MGRKYSDDDLLLLILSGRSQSEIAEELSCTKATISRRVRDKDFQDMLSVYRKKLLDGVTTDLVANTRKSVKVLVDLLDDKSSSIRLSASTKILQLAQDFCIQQDLLTQVEELKRLQQDR